MENENLLKKYINKTFMRHPRVQISLAEMRFHEGEGREQILSGLNGQFDETSWNSVVVR